MPFTFDTELVSGYPVSFCLLLRGTIYKVASSVLDFEIVKPLHNVILLEINIKRKTPLIP